MSLQIKKTIDIRFSEVDSMRVVWHGSYVKYIEDGREFFGLTYGLGYMDVASQGFYIPIVDLKLNYKRSAMYGDRLVVETRFVDTPAAKIVFEYTIYREGDMEVLMTGKSVQVFTDQHGQLMLNNPDFYLAWKQKMGL